MSARYVEKRPIYDVGSSGVVDDVLSNLRLTPKKDRGIKPVTRLSAKKIKEQAQAAAAAKKGVGKSRIVVTKKNNVLVPASMFNVKKSPAKSARKKKKVSGGVANRPAFKYGWVIDTDRDDVKAAKLKAIAQRRANTNARFNIIKPKAAPEVQGVQKTPTKKRPQSARPKSSSSRRQTPSKPGSKQASKRSSERESRQQTPTKKAEISGALVDQLILEDVEEDGTGTPPMAVEASSNDAAWKAPNWWTGDDEKPQVAAVVTAPSWWTGADEQKQVAAPVKAPSWWTGEETPTDTIPQTPKKYVAPSWWSSPRPASAKKVPDDFLQDVVKTPQKMFTPQKQEEPQQVEESEQVTSVPKLDLEPVMEQVQQEQVIATPVKVNTRPASGASKSAYKPKVKKTAQTSTLQLYDPEATWEFPLSTNQQMSMDVEKAMGLAPATPERSSRSSSRPQTAPRLRPATSYEPKASQHAAAWWG